MTAESALDINDAMRLMPTTITQGRVSVNPKKKVQKNPTLITVMIILIRLNLSESAATEAVAAAANAVDIPARVAPFRVASARLAPVFVLTAVR